MHAKSDSEVTSLPASSPPRSPRRPAYYVQSPSRDSHDGDSKVSFQSTPLLSPIGSPLHPGLARTSRDSSHSYARSRDSSASNHGESRGKQHHSGSRRVQPQPSLDAGRSEKGLAGWSTCTVIEEEPESRRSSTASQIYTILLVLLSCAVFLGLFILVFWLICKPGRPAVSVKNVVFHNLYMGQGTDASGVPSQMLTVDCTVQIDYSNPSKYFGAHLSPLQIDLDYSQLNIATNQIDGYVQGKGSRKVIPVVLQALKVPLYGAPSDLSTPQNNPTSIPLQMTALICSQYFIMGTMVKSRFCSQIACNLVVNSKTMALLSPLHSSCTYDPPL